MKYTISSITAPALAGLQKAIAKLNPGSQIDITITAADGDPNAAYRFYEFLLNEREVRFLKIHGHVPRRAETPALLILQGCETRSCNQSTTFLIANLGTKPNFRITARTSLDQDMRRLKRAKSVIQKLQQRYDEAFALRTGLTVAWFARKNYISLRSHEAYKEGFVDKVH